MSKTKPLLVHACWMLSYTIVTFFVFKNITLHWSGHITAVWEIIVKLILEMPGLLRLAVFTLPILLITIHCQEIKNTLASIVRNQSRPNVTVGISLGILILTSDTTNSFYISPWLSFVAGTTLLAEFIYFAIPSTQKEPEKTHADPLTQLIFNTEPPLVINQSTAVSHLINTINNPALHRAALFGGWGTGKTLVIDNVKQKIYTNNNKAVWIDFHPWRYTSEEALVAGFYTAIATELKKHTSITHLPNTHKIITLASELIKPHLPKSWAQNINTIANTTTEKNNDIQKLIQDIIKENKLTVVVAIDDCERQHDAKMVARTLQLVYSIDQINSLTTILVTDRKAIEKQIATIPALTENAQVYIDKFFQYSFELSPPSRDSIERYIQKIIQEYEKINPHTKLSELNDRRPLYTNTIPANTNYRTLQSIMLRFLSTIDMPIELEHKFLFDVTYVIEPDVFRNIRENKDDYWGTNDAHLSGHLSYAEMTNRPPAAFDRDMATLKKRNHELYLSLSSVIEKNESSAATHKSGSLSNRKNVDVYFYESRPQSEKQVIEDMINSLLTHKPGSYKALDKMIEILTYDSANYDEVLNQTTTIIINHFNKTKSLPQEKERYLAHIIYTTINETAIDDLVSARNAPIKNSVSIAALTRIQTAELNNLDGVFTELSKIIEKRIEQSNALNLGEATELINFILSQEPADHTSTKHLLKVILPKYQRYYYHIPILDSLQDYIIADTVHTTLQKILDKKAYRGLHAIAQEINGNIRKKCINYCEGKVTGVENIYRLEKRRPETKNPWSPLSIGDIKNIVLELKKDTSNLSASGKEKLTNIDDLLKKYKQSS